MRRQLPLRGNHGQGRLETGPRFHKKLILRHVRVHLSLGNGDKQQSPAVGQLPDTGTYIILFAYSYQTAASIIRDVF